MGNIRSIAERNGPRTTDGLAADQRMALLAQAFEIEFEQREYDHQASWSMGQTIWWSVLVSVALWGLIYAIIRII